MTTNGQADSMGLDQVIQGLVSHKDLKFSYETPDGNQTWRVYVIPIHFQDDKIQGRFLIDGDAVSLPIGFVQKLNVTEGYYYHLDKHGG